MIKEITWNECNRAQRRVMWMYTLRNDKICREQLRLDIRHFDQKLCHVWQTRVVTTKNVTVKETYSWA